MKKRKSLFPLPNILYNSCKGLLGTLLIILILPTAKAQTGKTSFRELFTQGNLMMNENFIDSALKTFIVLYPMDTSDANVCYFIGQLYLLTAAHKAEALPYLEKAAKHVATKYHPDDPYEKDAPPPVYYYLARAQHLNYQFDNAIDNFNRFKKLLEKDDKRIKDIDYWIACCNNGKELMKSPVDCKVINLGDSINSIYPDYSPVVSADEQEILFTSRRPYPMDSTKDINGNYYEDIWVSFSKRKGTGWGAAQNMGTSINTGGNEAAVSLSPDGQQLILYRDNSQGDGNLYVSNLSGLQWTYPNYIDSVNTGVVNSPSWEPSACMSPDRKTLYFASNRAGGLGGTDLYKVNVDDKGGWSTPVNLGAAINTEYDEDAPFIHPDDSTMFFSSKGHNTMGGFDVFVAKEDANGNWGNVTNIGHPINTPDDDIYFSASADGRRAYYTSVRQGGYGEKDNYEVIFNKPLPVQTVAVLVGYLITPDGSPLPNDITVTTGIVNGSSSATARVNPKTGKFLQILRPNQNYNVTINTQGKKIFDQKFFLPADSSYLSLSRAFFRTKIILGDTTNVFVPKKLIAAATTNTNVATAAMSGRILLNQDPLEPLSNMGVQLLDDKGNVVQTTLTNSDGFFTFNKLGTDSHYAVQVDVTDTKLKHLKKLLLVNSNNHAVRNYDEHKKTSYLYHDLPTDLNTLPEMEGTKPAVVTTTTAPGDADFTRYFGYNMKDVSADDAGFTALIDKITAKAATGSVTLSIEASASKVPTKLFASSNKSLANKRAKTTKSVILEALEKKQVDTSKIKISLSSDVEGPDYEHDAKDESKYQKFQYVKVYIR